MKASDILNKAASDVLAERERQKVVEGWTPEHDDTHERGEMARAAACYAYFATLPEAVREVASLGGSSAIDQVVVLGRMWRWHQDWWKPKDRRRDLVRAGALILAEIERIDRQAACLAKEREGAQ